MEKFLNTEIITKNAIETKKCGRLFAQKIYVGSRTSNIPKKHAIIISLEGDLGTGKTTFAQGFAKGLGIKGKIQSPTYVILKIYPVRSQACHTEKLLHSVKLSPDIFLGKTNHKKKTSNGVYTKCTNFIHIDAYRVQSKDFAILGWKTFINNPKNIILIEWGNKIKKILPKNTIRILFNHTKEDSRKIKIIY